MARQPKFPAADWSPRNSAAWYALQGAVGAIQKAQRRLEKPRPSDAETLALRQLLHAAHSYLRNADEALIGNNPLFQLVTTGPSSFEEPTTTPTQSH